MKVVSVLLGAVAVAGVGSKPTFDKLVHLYFSNIYIYIYIYISNIPHSKSLLIFKAGYMYSAVFYAVMHGILLYTFS